MCHWMEGMTEWMAVRIRYDHILRALNIVHATPTPDTPGSYCRKLPDDARKIFADLQSDTQQQVEAVPSPFRLHLSKVSAKAFN